MSAMRRPLRSEDPRRLHVLLDRVADLARDHGVDSVVVGVAGSEGDSLVPDLIQYIQSSLRVEDSIFRLTRERAVLFLADVRRAQVESILERLRGEFSERFPATRTPDVALGFFEIHPGAGDALTLKEVLPAIFAER